jgi:hypothetical protein
MAHSQNEAAKVHPNGARGVFPVDRLNPVVVQIEGAQDAARFSVPALV